MSSCPGVASLGFEIKINFTPLIFVLQLIFSAENLGPVVQN